MRARQVVPYPLLFLAALPLMADQTAGHRCAVCHPKEVSGYAATGMANSLFRPRKQPSGQFIHALSDTRFRIQSNASGMRQQMERNGFTAEYPVEYVIGSGNHAFGYLTRIGGYLFQSPVSYYSKRAIWDMAPGYERDREPDFTRPVTLECLLCHSGQPRPVPHTLNRYQDEPFAAEAITCDRCHGPEQAHLAKPSANNILNPAKLQPRARDSVCEQCHLGGEARIPNPGKRMAGFQAGRDLEEFFSVYVLETPAGKASTDLKVVSHVEQLALSTCARSSQGKMWCATCHDPHNKPADPVTYYREKCHGCHTSPLPAAHPVASADCIGCHMPRRQAKDGGHTAFTDHRIARHPPSGPGESVQRPLIAWREPAASVAKRNLGLANITVGERDGSAFYMDAGFRLLTEVYETTPDDPAVLTSLGLVILRKGKPAEAARFYERVLALEPDYAPYYINAATAWKEAGDLAKAIQYLEKAIAMDPSLESAYRKLGEIYARTKQPEKARQIFERYLRFMPDNVTARSALDLQ